MFLCVFIMHCDSQQMKFFLLSTPQQQKITISLFKKTKRYIQSSLDLVKLQTFSSIQKTNLQTNKSGCKKEFVESMMHHDDRRTFDFFCSLERLGGSSHPCRRAILELGMAHLMVTPRMTLSNNDVDELINAFSHAKGSLAAGNGEQTRKNCFLHLLQEALPLVRQSEFDAVRRRFTSLEAAIETAVAHVRNMPDARRLECVAQGRCVWTVDLWSAAAVDALLEALRVTTLGTVRDAFEHYTNTKCVKSLKGLLATKTQARLMVSAAGEEEFEVTTCDEVALDVSEDSNTNSDVSDDSNTNSRVPESHTQRFVQPANLKFFEPCRRWSYVETIDSGDSRYHFTSSAGSRPLMVDGPSGAGKTLAALHFAFRKEYNDSWKFVVCVLYCKAADFTTADLDTLDRGNPMNFYKPNSPSLEALHSSTRRVAEYVIVTLLGSCPPPTKVVKSYDCRVVIVVDDVGCFPSLVTGLIADYVMLTNYLSKVLRVHSVQIIAVGQPPNGFHGQPPNGFHARPRESFYIRHVGCFDCWKVCHGDLRTLPYITSTEKSLGKDTFKRGWLRAALANARFAGCFARFARNYFYARQSRAVDLFMCDRLVSGGLNLLVSSAMQHFLGLSALAKVTNPRLALQTAIGAMIDRRPFGSAADHAALLQATHGVVTKASTFVWGHRGYMKAENVLRTRVNPTDGGHACYVDGKAADNVCVLYYETLRKGRPFYMVDRVYCSMFMILFGGRIFDAFVPPCALARAVTDFAFLAASLPSSADLDGRPGVPPLRRLLNGLGNDASASSGACAWRAPWPLAIDARTDWSEMRTNSVWEELRTCVRGGRAAVVWNDAYDGPSLFVVAPQVVTLLRTVACPLSQDPLTAEEVKEALLRLAPVADWEDGGVAGPASLRSHFDYPLDDVCQQRVSEELVALARGVTFRRSRRTQRAVVRRPQAGDTAPPACVVNVAVVFEGAYAADLRQRVLSGAFGAQWSDLAASGSRCTGPFAVVREASPGGLRGRSRAEVVLDYVLDGPKDGRRRRRRGPQQAQNDRAPDVLLRVAYRYFLIDATWRNKEKFSLRVCLKSEKNKRTPRCSDSYKFARNEPLPALYPVSQTRFPFYRPRGVADDWRTSTGGDDDFTSSSTDCSCYSD